MEQSFKKKAVRICIPLVVLLLLIILAAFLLSGDFKEFLQWWLTLTIFGAAVYPFVFFLFSKFQDGGWLFSKVIGIALTGWLLWVLSSLKLLKFTRENGFLCIVIFLLLSLLFVFCTKKKKVFLKSFSCEKISSILVMECIFFLFFLFWCYLRGFRPEAYGTEKFMDYGFMTTMMRAEYMPPEDFWFSGNSINYYYLGQYMATFITKVSNVAIGRGYNFMLMTLAAFGFSLPYSIGHNVMAAFLKTKTNIKQWLPRVVPVLTGGISGIAVSIAGNFHYTVFRIFSKDGDSYWFPDATRYIGYNPDTADKTIHEFPSYSFILGDLHAHVINIMFVLTVVALLFSWLQDREEKRLLLEQQKKKTEFWKEAFHPVVILLGFFIGLFHTTNYWDFPIYYVVAGAVIFIYNLIFHQFKGKALLLTAFQGIFIFLFAKLVCLPFTLNFNQISTAFPFAKDHTPFYQFMVLWGLPIVTLLLFLIHLIRSNLILSKSKQKKKLSYNKGNVFTRFLENMTISDHFILILALCAIGLILIPEIIYVKDIYEGDYKRANTMFKLTYQSFILFGICMPYILIKIIFTVKKWVEILLASVLAALFLTTIPYFGNAVQAWFGDVTKRENYKGLDASAFIKEESLADYEATKWLNENVTGTPVVLEANGDSYTYYQRVSVITGLPTILGWKTHEWLWRSDKTGQCPAAVTERDQDIESIYTAQSVEELQALLQKYHISYIYVGELEKEKYKGTINHEQLRSIGTLVFEFVLGALPEENTYIVKVRE